MGHYNTERKELQLHEHYAKATGDNSYPNVNVETIRPSFADIFKKDSAKLTCKLSNVPSHANFSSLDVTWTQGLNKKPLETKLGQPMDQENGLQYIEATATVYTAEWNSKSSFPPSVYILPPSELTLKEIGTLTCLVKGFYPGDIFVQWLHNDQPVSDEDYFTSKPTMESKTPERFFAYSMLNINPQNWRSGDMYSCLVAHEALPINTTQKAFYYRFVNGKS
ncbi:Ig mu chain C region [Varanus komodoensis]|nr:Ig mu chain C region [Varanus komodoensis]